MKKFKLSQSKDDYLLKISSKKTNYEIKLTNNELSELRNELGFNFEVKLPMQEIETEKPIDWKKLSFPEWFYQTSKLEFDCHNDFKVHYMSDNTSVENANKLSDYVKKLLHKEKNNTETLYKILTNPIILKLGDFINIGKYKCSVVRNEFSGNYCFRNNEYGDASVFSQFGLSNKKIRNKFNLEKTNIYPETKTLKKLTNLFYYLKTFEV